MYPLFSKVTSYIDIALPFSCHEEDSLIRTETGHCACVQAMYRKRKIAEVNTGFMVASRMITVGPCVRAGCNKMHVVVAGRHATHGAVELD